MNWNEVEKEISKLDLKITNREIHHAGNKIAIYNVTIKEKWHKKCYTVHLVGKYIDLMDDKCAGFNELDKINKACKILNKYYEENKETLLKEYL